MRTLVDFDLYDDHTSAYDVKEMPETTKMALENYFIHGYMPGSFLTACLVGDLYRAVQSADTHNRRVLWYIVRWIMNHAPEGSWGSADAMRSWVADKNGCRALFKEQCEKSKVWLTLVK